MIQVLLEEVDERECQCIQLDQEDRTATRRKTELQY